MNPNFDMSAWNLPNQWGTYPDSSTSGVYPGMNSSYSNNISNQVYPTEPPYNSGGFPSCNQPVYPDQTSMDYPFNTSVGFQNPQRSDLGYPCNAQQSNPYLPGSLAPTPTSNMNYPSLNTDLSFGGLPNRPESGFGMPTSTFNSMPAPLPSSSNFETCSNDNYSFTGSYNSTEGSGKIYGFAETVPHEDIMEPTVKPAANFNAQKDCERLKNAMAGLGSNRKELVEVMTRRTVDQRAKIASQYKSMYGKELTSKFKSELSGHLEDCMEALCYSPDEFDARELRRAMRGAGTDEDILIEILCTRTNEQIRKIKEVYSKIFKGRDLEKDIKDETSGHFKRVLVALLQANRDESSRCDKNLARRDAEELYNAGEKRWGTDESKFNYILVSRSYAHLKIVFEEYRSFSRRTIEEALKSEMHGDLLNAFLTIVRCIQNKQKYFATQLMKSMKGLGTRDHTLIRIVISRCEIDMGRIKKEFLSLTGKTLENWIHDDTTGEYRKALLNLIGA